MKKMMIVCLLIGFLLSVPVGVAAEKAENEKPVWTMVGDGNRDLKVDAKDALLALQLSVSKYKPFFVFPDYFTGEYIEEFWRDQEAYVYHGQRIVVDVDSNDIMNANDALQILQYAVGKRDAFLRTDISNIDSMIWEKVSPPTDVPPTDK